MADRLLLHALLRSVLGSDNVYFQPPETVKLKYPCIIYKRDDIDSKYADNQKYIKNIRYRLTIIDRDPDSLVVEKVSNLPSTEFVTHFTVDNLNHDIYTIYY